MRLTLSEAGTLPLAAATLALAVLAGGPPAAAQGRSDAPRYVMQPVEGGLMKLDTRSGSLSFCSMKSGAWVCEAVPEDRAALEAEIARLQGKVAELEKGRAGVGTAGVPDIMAPPEPAPPGAPPPAASPAVPPVPPAGEEERTEEARKRLDQAMDMAEHVFRRFFEMVDRLRGTSPQGQSL